MFITDIIYFTIIVFGSYFVFFNLILWLENRGKFFSHKKITKFPSVSILIPFYNEEKVLSDTLENILKIDYPKDKLEILAIDDGSTDSSYEIVKKFEKRGIKVLRKKNGGKANSINFGIRHSKQEFVVTMDADSMPDRDALKNCMKYFDEEKVAAVTTRILPKRRTLWEKLQHIEMILVSFQRKLHEFPNVINCTPGPFSVYKRSVLEKVGKFDENNLVEDVEIAWRLISKGYKIRLAFDSSVYSYYPFSFWIWWKQRTRWAIGGIQTLVKYFSYAFRKDYHGVGSFLVPTSILGYSFAIIGIGLFIYLSGTQIFNIGLYFYKAISLGLNPFSFFSIGYLLDWKKLYAIMLVILFIITLKVASNAHKIKINPFLVLLYMFVYSAFYPFINLNGIYKYLRNERGWLTK